MSVRFDGFVLDVARRELRRGDEARGLQPQAFDLLAYLVANRARVVGKDELLAKLWPDVKVTDSSLQRAVSQIRTALADASSELIETHARRGYRFAGTVDEGATTEGTARESTMADVTSPRIAWPPPRFVEAAPGLHLAWRVVGEGDVTVVFIAGWSFPMDAYASHPRSAALIDRLAKTRRVLLFDRRGVGLSDRVKALATLTERADDLGTVLDAAGVGRDAVLVGFSEGAPVALTFAAEHPSRVRGLVLVGGFARMIGHDAGWSATELDGLRAYAKTAWGNGATVRAMFPAQDDEALRRWAAHVEITGASPGAALDLIAMNTTVDARSALPRVEAPAIVLHHREDRVIRVENGRELARGLRHVRYIEASGTDHVFAYDDTELLAAAIEELSASP